jgi:starch synthase (maltosyl-transferring)
VAASPIKRTVGESVSVTADVFADGHDLVAGVLKYRLTGPRGHQPAAEPARQESSKWAGSGSAKGAADPAAWIEVPLTPLGDDRWGAAFTVNELGEYEYTVEAWIDRFGSWRQGLVAKAEAGQDVQSELLEGAQLVEQLAGTGEGDHRLLEIADLLRSDRPQADRIVAARDPRLHALMADRPDPQRLHHLRPRAAGDGRAGAGAFWRVVRDVPTVLYDRSDAERHLPEAEARLPDIAAMGFDVVYLPPIHPIGRTHRKGRNNSLVSKPDDPGSPWAIGSDEGGHTAIEPGLGSLDDFDRFVETASHLGLAVALDIAFQASPDHPWVGEHPDWFRHRPDGSIKYAENPPKKYQDIYPFDFESRDRESLWAGLRDVFRFWIGHGVTIFRVDNPHTKPFRFWEWCIGEIRPRIPRPSSCQKRSRGPG